MWPGSHTFRKGRAFLPCGAAGGFEAGKGCHTPSGKTCTPDPGWLPGHALPVQGPPPEK